MIVIGLGNSHSRLRLAIIIERRTRSKPEVGESAVMIIVVQNARCRIAGHINVWPTIVIVIERQNPQRIVPFRPANPR